MIDRINLSNVKALNAVLTPLSPERMKELGLTVVPIAVPKAPPTASAAPSAAPDTLYAEVKANGKTVAKLYNSGCVETSNAAASKIDFNDDGSGPALAQQRAEKIAKALGGTIVKSPTAQSQSEWVSSKAQQQAALDAWSKNAGYNPNVQADLLLQAQES